MKPIAYIVLVALLLGCAAPPATLAPAPRWPTATPAPFGLIFASDRGGIAQLVRMQPGGTVVPLTHIPGGAWDPTLRPDGQLIAFTSYASDQGDIALLNPAGGEAARLVTHPAADYQPAWSPDGQRLAFVSERDGGQDLYLVAPRRPADQRRLTAASGLVRHRQPAWTPDGTALIFAGVDSNGVEELYRLDIATNEISPLTAWPLKATAPAVAADGRVAFVGWEAPPTRTLRLLGAVGESRAIYTSTNWLGNPAWSADGRWLLFTEWRGPASGHDLFAITEAGGEPLRLTSDAGWDDSAAPLPAAPGAVPVPAREVALGEPPPPSTHIAPALGMNVADLDNVPLLHELGATLAKGFVDWARTEPEPGAFDWRDADNTLLAFERAGLRPVLRLHNAPRWSHPAAEPPNTPPDDPAAFARFAAAVAARYRGRVVAYELWNEPNLAHEWAGAPDPAAYVALARAAYPALRGADPGAEVIIGGLASTHTGSASAMSDLDFLAGMYAAGAARGLTHDAIATHPYGFGRAPAAPADFGLGLRHVEAQRAVMLAAGDGASPLWVTETGWPARSPNWDLGEHAPWAVSLAAQGAFYGDLLPVAAREWPFVGAIFPFNLDFSLVAWYPAGEQMRAYALLNPDRSPRPAFSALRRAAR